MVRGVIGFAGRSMLCAIFIIAALTNKIPNFETVTQRMTDQGIPEAKLMLVGAIVFMLLGSLMVITGIGARFGALLLLIFLGTATYYFHDFWTIDASQEVVTKISGSDAKLNEIVHFMKNLAIAGALLMIVGQGVSRRLDAIDDGYLD